MLLQIETSKVCARTEGRRSEDFYIFEQLNLSQVSNKAASSVDKEKVLREYFHRGYPYAAIVSLLEKRHGVRMQVRMLKRKLKNRPRKVRHFAKA